jgi:type I restriction enzyme, S subunit
MSQLPNDWQTTTSGELCEYITSGSRDWRSFYSDHGPLFVRTQDINQDRLDLSEVAHVDLPEKVEGKRSRIQPGDLLVTITGANVGKVALVPDEIPEAYVSQSVGLMRLKDKQHGPYLHYYLQSDQTGRKQVLNLVYGIGRPVLSLQNLRDIPVALPPIPEQRRLVAEIEKQFTRLEAGVAALRRAQANLKRYRAAVLKAACEGRLVSTEAELGKAETTKAKFETGEALLARILTERRQNWQGRGKYKEPAALDIAKLPSLPEGWTWASVGQLLREPLCNGVSIKGSYSPPGVRALRLSAMSNSGFDYSDTRYLPLDDSDVDDLWIQEGDFFMSRGNGSLHLVGRGTSAQKPAQPTIFPDTMIRLRLADSVRASGWIRTLWPSRIIRSQVETRVKTTAGIYKIAQPQVEGMVVPLPPVAEQTRIVAEVERRLSVMEELESVVTSNLQRAFRLRQSILQKAFTGQLT